MTAHSEHLLKKEVVGNLQHRSALFAQCREHQISVGNLSLQILGQNFDGLPKLKRSPEHKKEGMVTSVMMPTSVQMTAKKSPMC
jgi:hypothetical protein